MEFSLKDLKSGLQKEGFFAQQVFIGDPLEPEDSLVTVTAFCSGFGGPHLTKIYHDISKYYPCRFQQGFTESWWIFSVSHEYPWDSIYFLYPIYFTIYFTRVANWTCFVMSYQRGKVRRHRLSVAVPQVQKSVRSVVAMRGVQLVGTGTWLDNFPY